MQEKRVNLIVNFGGPRDLTEIREFLTALLTDQDVIRTSFPPFIHRWIFQRVAKKRAEKIKVDYEMIGGGSPIYKDTETLAATLRQQIAGPIITFHRYLPKTHAAFVKEIEQYVDAEEIRVFPMFPQFSYATTGSIARWFSEHLSKEIVNKMRWIKSYPADLGYVTSFQACIRNFLNENALEEEKTILLFSAHGLPQKFITTGDVYQKECEQSFENIAKAFPKALCKLTYQSKFGRGEWIRPYTNESCEEIGDWGNGYSTVVFIPLSFTSDHIETLFEVEKLYLPICRDKGLIALRAPALNQSPDWIEAIRSILEEGDCVENRELVRA